MNTEDQKQGSMSEILHSDSFAKAFALAMGATGPTLAEVQRSPGHRVTFRVPVEAKTA